MKAVNLANLTETELAELGKELAEHKTLRRVLEWAAAKPKSDVPPQTIAEVVAQDEFTRDVVVPYKDLFLVYDTN
jgi:hypothetical protein